MATTGLTLPTSGTNDATAGSSDWTNPSNITSGVSFASSTAVSSKYLLGSAYGFSIPSGSTINGIEIEVKYQTPDSSISNNVIVPFKGGVPASSPQTVTFNAVGSPTTTTYGSNSTLWGETWSDTDINASNFGAAVRKTAGSGNQVSIYWIKVNVYYTAPGGSNVGFFF